MQRGRRIAFDFGDVRIGVAVSDASGLLASPHSYIQAQEDFIAEIILQVHGARGIREAESIFRTHIPKEGETPSEIHVG